MRLRTFHVPRALAIALGCALAPHVLAQAPAPTPAPTTTLSESATGSSAVAGANISTLDSGIPGDPAATTAALPEPTATAAPATEGFFAPSTIVTATVVPGGDVLAPDSGTVDSSPGEPRSSASVASDRSLLEAVVAALSADAALRGTNLNVTVSDGLVTITGTAATSEQVARVHDVATRAAGAGRVSAAITPSG